MNTTRMCLRGCKSLGPLLDGDNPHPYTGGTPLKIPQSGARCFFYSLAKALRTQRGGHSLGEEVQANVIRRVRSDSKR